VQARRKSSKAKRSWKEERGKVTSSCQIPG